MKQAQWPVPGMFHNLNSFHDLHKRACGFAEWVGMWILSNNLGQAKFVHQAL